MTSTETGDGEQKHEPNGVGVGDDGGGGERKEKLPTASTLTVEPAPIACVMPMLVRSNDAGHQPQVVWCSLRYVGPLPAGSSAPAATSLSSAPPPRRRKAKPTMRTPAAMAAVTASEAALRVVVRPMRRYEFPRASLHGDTGGAYFSETVDETTAFVVRFPTAVRAVDRGSHDAYERLGESLCAEECLPAETARPQVRGLGREATELAAVFAVADSGTSPGESKRVALHPPPPPPPPPPPTDGKTSIAVAADEPRHSLVATASLRLCEAWRRAADALPAVVAALVVDYFGGDEHERTDARAPLDDDDKATGAAAADRMVPDRAAVGDADREESKRRTRRSLIVARGRLSRPTA